MGGAGQGARGSQRMRGGSSLHTVGVSELGSMPAPRRAGSPWIVRIFISLVVLVVLGAVGFAVAYNANIMPVTKLTVSGTTHLTNEELTELAQVPAKTTLFNVDATGIEERLRSNPWVLNATVERIPPDTLNLKIEERSITAVVDVTVDENATVETWALSEDGVWLTQVPTKKQAKQNAALQQLYDDSTSALKISDVPLGSRPEAGASCADANIKNALGIVAGMTTELADQVKYVSAASAESTTLVLNNGVEVAFGDDTSIRDKERVCLELLKEHEGKISYINVRTVNNPIWRSLSQDKSTDDSSDS